MSSYHSLEKALSKIFDPKDIALIESEDFHAKVQNMVSRRAAQLGIRDYLRHSGSSPRIAALIAYSNDGAELMRSWVEEKGMPVAMLYSALLSDGGAWTKISITPAIAKFIEEGDERWNFDPRQMFYMYSSVQSVPGVFEAMIHRMRKRGEIDKVFYLMPTSTIADLLRANRDAFIEEEQEMPREYRRLIDKANELHDLAICLCRTFLSPEKALEKMLGSEPVLW